MTRLTSALEDLERTLISDGSVDTLILVATRLINALGDAFGSYGTGADDRSWSRADGHLRIAIGKIGKKDPAGDAAFEESGAGGIERMKSLLMTSFQRMGCNRKITSFFDQAYKIVCERYPDQRAAFLDQITAMAVRHPNPGDVSRLQMWVKKKNHCLHSPSSPPSRDMVGEQIKLAKKGKSKNTLTKT